MKVAPGQTPLQDPAAGIAELVDQVDAILWIADPHTLQFLYVSQGAERILGYPTSEWLRPDFWVSILHPGDRHRCVSFCREQVSLGLDHEFRYRALASDGRVVWLRDNVRVEVDSTGIATKLHGVMFDISDRQARSAQQAAVGHLGNLALSLPLRDLLAESVRVAAETLDADVVEVCRVDPDAERLTRAASSEAMRAEGDGEVVPWGPRSWARFVMATSGPVIVRDLSTETEFGPDERLEGLAAVSGIGVSIGGAEGRTFGILDAYSRSERSFSSDEAHFLGSVATIIAAAATRVDVERELKRREKQLATAQEIASLGSWEWIPATGKVWWSKELFAVHGQDPQRFQPSYESFLDIIVPEDRDDVRACIEASARTLDDLEFDYRFVRSDGTRRRGHALAKWVGTDGRVDRLIGTVQDVTESKEADLRVRNSEHRLRAIFDNAGIGMATVTPLGRIREANRMLHVMLGYRSGHLRGKHFADITHPDDIAVDRALYADLLEGLRDEYSLEKRFLRADGEQVWGFLTATVVRDEAGEPTMAVGMVQDITARKQALEDLVDSRTELSAKSEELARLTRRLVELQELERRSIAHDLHDEVGQILTGLKLTLEAAPATEAAGTVSARALPLVEDLISLVRDMTLTLRPPMLDDLGLLPTLRWHVSRYEHATGVAVDLRQWGIDRRFDPNLETAAYRVIQEALTNVARHSGATAVMVDVYVEDGCLRVKVADQGVGFNPADLDGSSHGLLGMRERLSSLGGRFWLDSVPRSGTVVTAELPLRAEP